MLEIRSIGAVLGTALLALAMTTGAPAQVVDFRDHVPPEGAAPEELPAPAEIIERHVEATGGRDAYERVHNRKLVGTFRQGDEMPESPITMHRRRPNEKHVRLDLPGGTRVYVTNADESWTYEGEFVTASSGDQKRQEIRRAVFDLLLDWRRHYELAKTIGIEDVDGRPAYKVRLTAEDCHKLFLLFDCETSRLVRTDQEIAYAGDTIRTETWFSDFRIFDGIELATRSRRILVYQGTRTVQRYVFTSIEHDVEVPEGLFDTPAELRPAPAPNAPNAPQG